MEIWFIIVGTLCLCAALKPLLDLLSHRTKPKHPPGPWTVPIIGNFLWLRKSLFDLNPILRNLNAKYGSIVSLPIGSRPNIFIRSHSLAHQALVQNGSIFAARPPSQNAFSKQRAINSSTYGPFWRLLRRNLTSEILHPSRLNSYSSARKRVLKTLISNLKEQSESGKPIQVLEHLRYAMFSILLFMSLGQELDEKVIQEAIQVQRLLISSINRYRILTFMPKLGKIIFQKLWKELIHLRTYHTNFFNSLIRARKEGNEKQVASYVDTLFKLWIPEEGRNFNEEEIRALCSEFINAGTDTTATVMEWIMANLVKHQDIQEKLFSEIKGVVGLEEEISEKDLKKMPYLKAVVMEGLRLHPPLHFGLPHTVTEESYVDGYVIPKNASVHFMIAEMGRDPQVWENPMEFWPERFLSDGGEGFDITGSREIKMMPFGAGRRICPGLNLALLHLEYFVANMVKEFKWVAVDGEEVDLSEKQEVAVMMKTPLRAHISPRRILD
ncbi:cytochrome P450 89A2-like [Telopea speciosissima]|uniref:cytochrome P450 89A2-like n=1 Tax=Telopea speciosissima TaxID=54955 RepID=UPI001CC61224|nr:cytochrome P450 89A2-like [Telopea speciosissima]